MPFRRIVRRVASAVTRRGAAAVRRLGRHAAAALSRLGSGRGGHPTADEIGRRGERVAAKTLRRRGYRILARRRRTSGGEVDLVAMDGDTIVLVEVKASLVASGARGPDRGPAGRVDHRKRRRLSGASSALLRGALARRPRRIDVVAVVFRGPRADVTVLRGAVRTDRSRGPSAGA